MLLYIDRSVLNEYTSPQAFTALRDAGRDVWRPTSILGVVDHVNSTAPVRTGVMPDPGGAEQVRYFTRNCREFGIELFDVLHPLQGIEHVVAPELGLIMPGMAVAAGDSHTATYGAFGALGFGIGTSDIEHMLATSTVVYGRLKSMLVEVAGQLAVGVTAKDIIMSLIGRIGADGATGYALEFAGRSHRRPERRRSHDDLQHVRRVRRARGPDRARPEGSRLPEGATPRPPGSALGPRGRRLAGPAQRRGRRL